jgi:flagellar basal-body rod protein FlgF
LPPAFEKRQKTLKKPLWHSRCLAQLDMDVSLYQAAAAMSATAQWQDLIAENLTAASVPGARRQEISFSDVAAGLASNLPSGESSGYYLPKANVVTNFKPGELRPTGDSMDFALEGPGFFSIQTGEKGNEQTVYSRDGEFRLNSLGQLVTKAGDLVLSNGGPVRFNPNSSSAITVSADGDISQGDQSLGKLKTVEFANPRALTKIGSGLFTSNDPANPPVTSTTTKIRQGFVEGSNASPTTEMASMITAMRMFEANQKVLQMQSDRMSRVITDLGGTSSS